MGDVLKELLAFDTSPIKMDFYNDLLVKSGIVINLAFIIYFLFRI